MFGDLVRNRRWLDVGAGVGGVIEQLRSVAREITAVEPQPQAREALLNSGYRAVRDLSNLAGEQFDVVTLFHVFEHLLDPQATLRQVHELMSTDGRVVIEVPHARDLLLSLLKVEAFMAFTFWSEHLILHTRESLTTFLEKAGFRDVSVQGVQRYPLANHLRWLHSSEPGGHETWRQLRSPGLDQEYQAMLDRLDATDTIVATARV